MGVGPALGSTGTSPLHYSFPNKEQRPKAANFGYLVCDVTCQKGLSHFVRWFNIGRSIGFDMCSCLVSFVSFGFGFIHDRFVFFAP
ncbi:hypothetical protein VNO77_05418 [Canavalia gladiata]|uniref:Uncharacterized protein n=1 Tax=Canavalia gladiata TaxID=3824 RepID=A0AAN9MYZ5_CANGL